MNIFHVGAFSLQNKKSQMRFLLTLLAFMASCSSRQPVTTPPALPQPSDTQLAAGLPATASSTLEVQPMTQTPFADVLSVRVTGEPGAYQFAVEIASPDSGCEQYADWWEVVSQDGDLLYRRILLHSHVGEQPFVRSGGPVDIAADAVVYVRAHMNTSGYGGGVMQGTVRDGFEPVEVEAGFGLELERIPPQPEDCAF